MQEHATKQRRHKQPLSGQLTLPIDYAPAQLRAYGYADAHRTPLVSRGKVDGMFTSSFRVQSWQAWDYPSIELRTGNSWPALVLDLDRLTAAEETYVRAVLDNDLPAPNWIVQKHGGGAHVVYCLVDPVHRGAQAREKPLRLLARVSEWLGVELNADPGYVGVLTHNPAYSGSLVQLTPWWIRPQGYELRELLDYVPTGWRKPKLPKTAIGRNCALFESLMSWAGSPRNIELAAEPVAWALNQELDVPLGWTEIKGIARSVEKYRARWLAQGRFHTRTESLAWSHSRRKAGLRTRRNKARRRALQVQQLLAGGMKKAEIARELGLHRNTVHYLAVKGAQTAIST